MAYGMKRGAAPKFKDLGSQLKANRKDIGGKYKGVKQKDKPKVEKSTVAVDGQLNDAEIEAKEDAAAVTTNIKTPPVMKSGSSNRVISKDGVMNTEVPHQFRKPKN